ncbi:21315_t:CDS:2 [Gigaspora margarita]|uniref:21315_t:CDS:1 n=1 Tax=Gigaspora margarita TaxID=4874 RepID=A0ABM8W531_GIGMA|nr:21315_t:CDS:2 [Gigaspora margarita]
MYCTKKYLLYHNEKFVKIVENYLANIHEYENNLIQINKQYETANLNSLDKKNKITNIQLRNLYKIITKGRPKSVHYNKSNKETKKKVIVEQTSNEEQTSDNKQTSDNEQEQ